MCALELMSKREPYTIIVVIYVHTHLVSGHKITETDAAQWDETEVAAVQRLPVLPSIENDGANQNVSVREYKRRGGVSIKSY